MDDSSETELVPIVIVDKSAVLRSGLLHILAGSRFRIVAACARPADLPDTTLSAQHRCVLLIGLEPDPDVALSWVLSQKENQNGLRVVALAERLHLDQALRAIEAGADGYLLKNEISPEGLLKSLEVILEEGLVIPRELFFNPNKAVAGGPIASSSWKQDTDPRQPVPSAVPVFGAHDPRQLSNREHAILRHLTLGASNKLIARELNITEATVKVHVKSLLRKIRVSNRTQAAMWATNNSELLNEQ